MTRQERIVALAQAIGLDIKNLFTNKQDVLVSGENIKTVNGVSLLGSGNINTEGAYELDFQKDTNSFFYNIYF